MRISLQTYGGIAGGMRLPGRSIDLAPLGGDAARKAEDLVAKAARAQAHVGPSAIRPDEMSYAITVEEAGAVTVINANETSMTIEFAELLDWLEELFSAGH